MRNLFLQFCIEWLDWVKAGADEESIFTRREGLCGNFERYLASHSIEDDPFFFLIDLFKKAELNSVFPFGTERFSQDTMNETMHLDERRIVFAKKFIRTHS